jgi:hypothetical protein
LPFTEQQRLAVDQIKEPTIAATVQAIDQFGILVHVPGTIYSRKGRAMSHRDVLAFIMSYATMNGIALKNMVFADLAINRYTQIVGTTPITAPFRAKFAAEPDHDAAWAGVMEVASWGLAAATMDAAEKERLQTIHAHYILRWMENVKRRIYGLPLEDRQIVLSFWGASRANKSATAKKLIAPLQDLVWETPEIGRILLKHEGGVVSQNLALYVDDAKPMKYTELGPLKQFVFAESWVADVKIRDAVKVPMLASVIFCHNDEPGITFPDVAMAGRLGAMYHPRAFPPGERRRFTEERILPFDILSLWRAVDHVNRQSDDQVIEEAQDGLGEKLDLLQYFLSTETTKTSDASWVSLADVYTAFQVRARAGGWNIYDYTDRKLASRLRGLGYYLGRGNGGMIVKGLLLEKPKHVASAVEAQNDRSDPTR